MSMPPASAPGPNSQPEFTHAIQYINRIKTRFADEPETYKQFLEILQMYQKEQRVLQDVYDQVTRLFHNAPELIDEFKMFLPDTNATANSNMLSLGAGMSTGVRRAPHDDASKDGPPTKRRRGAPPDKDSVGPPTQQHTLMHAHGTVPPHVHPIAHVAITSHPPHALHVAHGAVLPHPPHPLHVTHAAGPALSHMPAVQPIPPLPEVFFDRLKRALDDRDSWEDFLKLLTMYSMDVLDEPLLLQMATPFLGGTGSELEIMFRELLGVGIDGKRREDTASNANYIMNNAELSRVTGHARGLGTFNSTGATAGMGSVYLTGSKYRFGSYRRLPESETKLACSGRDEICRSVLNDEWVSHPTWASEDSGFVAHKKNTYEEAMHKSEEERHEYHVQLEAMIYTISLLEPIALKITNMSPEEKATFKLGPSLGGRSKSVHQKIIKKVYNRENASEVLQALQDNPAVSVPVVLERLKLVDAEWRKNKREWEKIWREVDARNFYKSLDHQGVSFKVNDKKTITGKALLAEIERIKGMQNSGRDSREEDGASGKKTQDTRLSTDNPRSAFSSRKSISVQPRYQLQYSITDPLVLQDAIKLTLYFLERNDSRQGGGAGVPQYNVIERRRIEAFLRHYVKFQFEFSRPFSDSPGELFIKKTCRRLKTVAAETSNVTIMPNEFDLAFGPSITDEEWEELGLYIPDPAAGTMRTNNNGIFVSSVTEHGNGDRKSPTSKDNIQDAKSVDQDEDPVDIWIRHVKIELPKGNEPVSMVTDEMVVDAEDSRSQHQQKKFTSFFCNTTFYTLIRMLQLLYSRLLMCKELAAKLAHEKFGTFLPNPIASALGLTDLAGPLAYFGDLAAIMIDSNASSKFSSIPVLNGSSNPTASADTSSDIQDPHSKLPFKPAEHFYSHLLDLVEKLFDGELEQHTFEENMRFMFGTRAYVMFTLDKLCGAICKQVQAVVQDNRCHELMTIFEQQRKREVSSDKDSNIQNIIRYRRRAETLAGSDENLFRVDWNPEQRKLRIQLLDLDDPSLDPPETTDAKIYGQSDASNATTTSMPPATTPEKVSSKMTVGWKQYVESYILIYPTERRRIGIERKVFLRRTLLNDGCEELNDSQWIKDVGRGGMEVMIGPGTYKLYYTRGCEEAGWRVSIKKVKSTAAAVGENEKSGGGSSTSKPRGSGKKRRAPSNEEPEVETTVDEWERLKERAENRKRERRRWMIDRGYLTL